MIRPGEYGPEDKKAQEMLEAVEDPTPQPAAPKADAAKESEEKAAPQTWEDRIKAAGLTEDQAYVILNAILDNNFFSKEFSLFGGKLKVTFRTRDSYARQRIANALDELRTNDPIVHFQTRMRLSLAGSLLTYRSTTFTHPNTRTDIAAYTAAFNERLTFLDNLADPILDALYPLLSQFDTWTYAALSNGAPTSF
jgi:hypothetical protein